MLAMTTPEGQNWPRVKMDGISALGNVPREMLMEDDTIISHNLSDTAGMTLMLINNANLR